MKYFVCSIKRNGQGSEYLVAVRNKHIVGYQKITEHSFGWDIDEPELGEFWPVYKIRNRNHCYLHVDPVITFKETTSPTIRFSKMKNTMLADTTTCG